MLFRAIIASDDAPQRWGFSLFAAWLMLFPRTALAGSESVYGNAIALSGAFAALLALTSALDAALAWHAGRLAPVFLGILGAAGGWAFLLVPDAAVRLACFCLQMAVAVGLLACWGETLRMLGARELLACALAALAATALFSLLMTGIATALSVVGNAQAYSHLMLAALGALPVASAGLATARPRGSQVQSRAPVARPCPKGTGTRAARAAQGLAVWGVEGRGASGQWGSVLQPRSCGRGAAHLLTPCLASAVTAFAGGFAYLPYYLDGVALDALRSCIIAAIALCGAWCLARGRAGAPHAGPFLAQGAGYLTLIGVLLAVAGLSGLIVGQPLASLAARSMLGAAHDCSFLAAYALLCSLMRHERRSFPPAFALGLLATGLFWGAYLGMALKHALGYDLRVIAPVSSACMLVLAAAFFLALAKGAPGADRAAREGLGPKEPRCSAPPDGQEPARVPGEALPMAGVGAKGPKEDCGGPRACEEDEEAGGERMAGADLDAARAHEVLAKARKRILAPYRLSPRELQVALMTMDGSTAQATSEALGISIATVKFHLGNAYRKIGIQSKAELVQLAKGGAGGARAGRGREHGA